MVVLNVKTVHSYLRSKRLYVLGASRSMTGEGKRDRWAVYMFEDEKNGRDNACQGVGLVVAGIWSKSECAFETA